jgi:hypothetical protein
VVLPVFVRAAEMGMSTWSLTLPHTNSFSLAPQKRKMALKANNAMEVTPIFFIGSHFVLKSGIRTPASYYWAPLPCTRSTSWLVFIAVTVQQQVAASSVFWTFA